MPREHASLADTVFRVVFGALDSQLGTQATGLALRQIREYSDLLAERYLAKGLHACVACDHLTHSVWIGAPMCNECQERNPAIQQMKAVKTGRATK